MSRRATLGGLSQSTLNTRSNQGIGIDRERNERSNNSRQSLGPPQISETLIKPSMTINNNNRRPSNPRSSSAGMGQRMSLSQQNPGRPSAAGRADPRNINNRTFMSMSIRSLIDYLTAHNYDHSISPKILTSPSGKDFNNIVQFLFRQIDPNLTCPGKFEDEVIAIFKFLRYPYNISKNGLSAVGSPHSWPQLLASLMWIIELLEYDEEVANNEENIQSSLSLSLLHNNNNLDSSQYIESIEDENTLAQKTFFRYLKKAYICFLGGDDDGYARLEQEFIQSYEVKNQVLLKQTLELEESNQQLEREIEMVDSRRLKLPELKKKKQDYEDDKNKFEKLIEQLMEHKEMSEKKKTARQYELEKLTQSIDNIEQDITLLKDTISKQELSPEDVRRMCEEKEHLQLALQNATEQLSQLNKKTWDVEVKLRDKLQSLEEAVRLFNSMCEDLDYAVTTAGTTPEKANIKKKVKIEIDTRAKKRGEVILTDVRKDIIPRFHRMKSILNDTTVHCKGEIIICQDTIEEIELNILKLIENKTSIENKIKRNDEIYKKERNIIDSNSLQYENEINELETKLIELKDYTKDENHLIQATRRINELKQIILTKRNEHQKKKEDLNQEILFAITVLTEYKEKMKEKIAELKEVMNQKLQQTLSIEINEVDGVIYHQQSQAQQQQYHHHHQQQQQQQLNKSSNFQNTRSSIGLREEISPYVGNYTNSNRFSQSESPIQETSFDLDNGIEYGSLHDIRQSLDDENINLKDNYTYSKISRKLDTEESFN